MNQTHGAKISNPKMSSSMRMMDSHAKGPMHRKSTLSRFIPSSLGEMFTTTPAPPGSLAEGAKSKGGYLSVRLHT